MSTVSRRLAELQAGLRPLMDFLTTSDHARRIGDPAIADFVFGNPHEMPLEELVASIRRHAEPASKDRFAYTINDPTAAATIAESLRSDTAQPIDPSDVHQTPGAGRAAQRGRRAGPLARRPAGGAQRRRRGRDRGHPDAGRRRCRGRPDGGL
jgi:hypothetical protein